MQHELEEKIPKDFARTKLYFLGDVFVNVAVVMETNYKRRGALGTR